ncbi:endonuclease NucS domain-containing protein [Microtetraspora malaysiensis]|uniref:endonuclease NucS domain-containing protein n=1 Tax=Microtetraspora malaysiensis TaxID=161358 RepID=UPI003D928711
MQSSPRESVIRDLLKENLHVIEPGLRLVKSEFPLANAHGTRGSIDILARDQYGMWVVIELKRLNSTARQAVHEVAKYTELLCREKQLPADRIRAIIIALDPQWSELLTPVSNLARDWSYDLRGYQLTIARDGTPLNAERVSLLEHPFGHALTPIQFVYFFNSPEDRDQGWKKIIRYASEAHAHDIAGADLHYIGPSGIIRAPYALYCAIGRIDSRLVPPGTDVDEAENWDEEEPDDHPYPLEYAALCHICANVFAVGTVEDGSPDEFVNLVNHPNWELEGLRGSGAYTPSELLEEQDILRALKGQDGGAQVLFDGSANTKIASRWAAFREAALNSLAGNTDWTMLVGEWLDKVADLPQPYDVALHVYNPCDLLSTIVFGAPGNLAEHEPMVLGFAVSHTEGVEQFRIQGQLQWGGARTPNLEQCVMSVYRDPIIWGIARNQGVVWQHDQALLDLLGLRYVIYEIVSDSPLTRRPEDLNNTTLLMPSEAGMRRITGVEELRDWGWKGALSLETFLEEHAQQVAALLRKYHAELAIHITST